MEQSRILVVMMIRKSVKLSVYCLRRKGMMFQKRETQRSVGDMNDHIDLYILDIMMPYMDGYELCEHSETSMHQFCF